MRMTVIRSVVLASLVLTAPGCSSKPPEPAYDLPVHELYQRLQKADLDGFKLARQCGLLIHFGLHYVDDQEIGWRVTSSGREMVTFKIILTPDGPGRTRTRIEVSADPKGGEKYDGDYFEMHPALHQPLRPAVQELINAAVEKRPYNVWKIPEPINTNDDVCSVQRGSLEQGTPFHVDDKPGDMPGESQKRNDQAAPRTAEAPDETPAEAGWGGGETE